MGIHKTKHRKGSEPYEPYVRLDYVMINSAAWKILTPDAQRILPHILSQWKAGSGLTRLSLPTRHTEWLMRREHRAAADQDLVARGFLDLVERAGLSTPAVYSRSERWRTISQDLMKDPSQGHIVILKNPVKGEKGISQWEPARRAKNPTQRECGMKGKANPEKRTSPGNRYKRPTQCGPHKEGHGPHRVDREGLPRPTQGGPTRPTQGGPHNDIQKEEEA